MLKYLILLLFSQAPSELHPWVLAPNPWYQGDQAHQDLSPLNTANDFLPSDTANNFLPLSSEKKFLPSDTANIFLSLDENPEMDGAIDVINQIMKRSDEDCDLPDKITSRVCYEVLRNKKIELFTQHLFRNHK